MVRTIEEFAVADASRLHLDLTAIRFAGAHPGSELVTKGWAAELPAFVAALDTLRAQLPSRLVVVADSGLGYLGALCALNTAGTRFVVPLRADTGWAQRFDTDPAARLDTLQTLDHVCTREQRLPAQKRTVWKGLLRPFPVTDDTGTHHDLRVAYIWSSEEAASVAQARERALTKAEDALTRVRNGLGGRYYKTRKQVGTKVATTLGRNISDLLHVTTATRGGKPTITWARDTALKVVVVQEDGPYFDRLFEVIFGLIEANLRHTLGDGVALPGLLPEHRAAIPPAAPS